MRVKTGIIIIISLLFLVGSVAANIPDKVTVSSDKTYLTANGVDQSIITVTVSNTTSGFIPGASINFTVLDPALGTVNPLNGTSDLNGKATSTFKVKTKSGFSGIRVETYYSDATGLTTMLQYSLRR